MRSWAGCAPLVVHLPGCRHQVTLGEQMEGQGTVQVGSAFGVLDPHPPGSPMLAAAPQKACGDKKAGGMRGHPQLSHHGGNMHSSQLAFITDHRPCLWSEELGPLSAGPIREQRLCGAGAAGWTGFPMGVIARGSNTEGGGRNRLLQGPDPSGCGSGQVWRRWELLRPLDARLVGVGGFGVSFLGPQGINSP